MTRTCSVARSGHNRDDCWDVEARVGEIVRVEFTSINMEPIHDHLYVSGESVAGGGPMVGAKWGRAIACWVDVWVWWVVMVSSSLLPTWEVAVFSVSFFFFSLSSLIAGRRSTLHRWLSGIPTGSPSGLLCGCCSISKEGRGVTCCLRCSSS